MRIYTKTGDTGLTCLIGRQKVSKNDSRLHAYGTVDELSAIIGGILLHIPDKASYITKELNMIQKDLFDIGSCLASIDQSKVSIPLDQRIFQIEQSIDQMTLSLPQLKSFILPSGHAGAVFSHMARTVCRRSERMIVGLIEQLQPDLRSGNYEIVQKYLNRLSDYFFTLARYINYCCDIEDIFVDKSQ
jgi:cob(I)alamin adenosyltransferase